MAHDHEIITPELKKAGNKLVWLRMEQDHYELPVYASLKDQYAKFAEDIHSGKIVSAYALDRHGIAAAVSKMAFGNGMGVKLEETIDKRELFAPAFGDLIAEVPAERLQELSISYTLLGEVTADNTISYGEMQLSLNEAVTAWKGTLESVFPTVSEEEQKMQNIDVQPASEKAVIENGLYRTSDIHICTHKIGQPTVFIPVFPGTNSEYDSAKAFEKEGAKVNLVPFVTLNEEAIVKSVDTTVDNIEKANIIFFAGGFSAADEPDGSAKFIVNILLNEKVRAAIDSFIERGGLIIGICNGFQALVKSGLLPYGNFEDASSTSPTLFYNDANQHVAKMVGTRIANTNSPWLAGVEVGDIHAIPVSHGEGKFVVTAEEFAELRDNGQIFTQYVDFEGKPSMDSKYNPNGSVNAIEGITSKNGQIIGKMGHSERFEDGLFQNIPGNKDQHLFASAVKYFTGK